MKNLLKKYLNNNIRILPADILVELVTVSEEYFVVREVLGTEHYFPYSSIIGISILPSPEKLLDQGFKNDKKQLIPLLYQPIFIHIDNFDNTAIKETLFKYLE